MSSSRDRLRILRAQHQRAYRVRKKRGLMILQNVLVDDIEVPLQLVEAGLLREHETNNPKAVGRAVSRAIFLLSARGMGLRIVRET